MPLQKEGRYTFAVAKGDAREAALCRLLRQMGYTVLELSKVDEAESLQALPEYTYYITRSACARVRDAAEKHNIFLLEYALQESYQVRNAVITAENALQVAMDALEITLNQSRVLVVGYGRIGSVLTRMLQGLGAHVCCAARRPEVLQAIAGTGCKAVHTAALPQVAGQADVIFNTVPALLLDRRVLQQTQSDVLVIDLASRPGGVDFAVAAEMGRQVIHALALPGKLTPVAAAQAIWDAVRPMLQREEVKL